MSLSKVLNSGVVNMYDQNGKLVYSQTISEQTNQINISTAEFSQGIYTVHVADGQEFSQPVKIVVVH